MTNLAIKDDYVEDVKAALKKIGLEDLPSLSMMNKEDLRRLALCLEDIIDRFFSPLDPERN